MANSSKRHRAALAKVDREKRYTLEEAVKLAVETDPAKFDETVELAVRLGVDPRQADQNVRGTVVLPHGTGKTVRVAVFAKGDKAKEAQDAGADAVGADDLVEKITKENWLEFDSAVATPDLMGLVGRLGRVLGPRGLMPNPKVGTVTADVGKAIREAKGGKVEFRAEKAGIVHAPVGKASFPAEKLVENVRAFADAVQKAKPSGAKGSFVNKISISSTMGPGVKIEPATVFRAEGAKA